MRMRRVKNNKKQSPKNPTMVCRTGADSNANIISVHCKPRKETASKIPNELKEVNRVFLKPFQRM